MPSTTPNFGFEYPLSSDNLSDGAQSIQDFATTADNTFVDLLGGTTGQYLTKTTNTNMDFTWVNGPTADSGWPVAGTGYYFGPRLQYGTGAIGTGSATANFMLLLPLAVPRATNIDRIAIEVTTGVAASTIRLGVYDNDGTGGAPSTLLNDFGTVSSATNGIKELTVSATLPAGLCYLGFSISSNTVVVRTATLTANGYGSLNFQDNTTDAFASSTKWWGKSSVSGAFPNPSTATLGTLGGAGFTTGVPIIMVRAA